MYGFMDKIMPILGIAVVIGIIVMIRKRSRGFYTTTLVLTQVKINRIPEDNTLIYIKGRASGLISWILNLMKLAADGSLLVTTEKAHFNSSSLSGDTDHVVSLKNGVASVSCEYHRSISLLIWAAVTAFTGFILLLTGVGFTSFLLALVLAGIFCLIYYFNKNIVICLETKGGAIFGLRFKPSFIENINMDMSRAKEIVEIINNQVITLQAK